jgi:hypothetical protein
MVVVTGEPDLESGNGGHQTYITFLITTTKLKSGGVIEYAAGRRRAVAAFQFFYCE